MLTLASPPSRDRRSDPRVSIHKFDVLEDRAKLATHLAGIPRDRAYLITLNIDVITRSVERDPHTPTSPLRKDNPREADHARVPSGHDLSTRAKAEAPLGGSRGIDHAIDLGAAA